jgi:hypothetical protein
MSSMSAGSERAWGLEEPPHQRSNQRRIHNEMEMMETVQENVQWKNK